jgi:sec-independent protein translocase protein TatA
LGTEVFIVLGIAVLLFGSSQLPKLARSLGEAKGEFERGTNHAERANDHTEGNLH